MRSPKVETDFIEWCRYIHPDINPYLFFQRHARYSDEYFPLFEDLMTSLYQELSEKLPNINFSFKGRIKSKRSFLIKSFRTMAESIEKLFPNDYPVDELARKELQETRSKNIEKYFKFLLNDRPPKIERYVKIKNMIEHMPPELGTLDSFRTIFSQLTIDEKESLVTRLGRTEDTFANRIIVNSVDFDMQSIKSNHDGQVEMVDEHGNTIPLSPAIHIPSDQIIEDPHTGIRYALINGEKIEISEHNLLYDANLSSRNRTFNNALKNDQNELTLLQDSLMIDDQTQFNILSTYTDPQTGDIHVIADSSINSTDNNPCESINISELLRNNHSIKLKKIDSTYTEKALYDIQNAMYQYYDEMGITRIWTRSKDYVKTPKQDSNYKSLHDSFFYEVFGYSLETQVRDLEMEKNCENKIDDHTTDSSLTSHDSYKKEKLKKWSKNPILHPILEKNPEAFDSSTKILEMLLYNPNVSLPDLLGKYILVGKFAGNKIDSYIPEIRTVFEHTFHNPKAYKPDPQDPLPPLDFSSYGNFMSSRKSRNDARNKGNNNIDLDYIFN